MTVKYYRYVRMDRGANRLKEGWKPVGKPAPVANQFYSVLAEWRGPDAGDRIYDGSVVEVESEKT